MFRSVILGTLLGAAIAAPSEKLADVGTQCVFNSAGLPISFQVEGCSVAPCVFPQLDDAVLKVKFNAPIDSEVLRARMVAYLSGLPIAIPYDLGSNSLACGGLINASCPVKEGQELEYTLKLHIEGYFPVGTFVNLEFSISDEASNTPAFCGRVPVAITAPRDVNELQI